MIYSVLECSLKPLFVHRFWSSVLVEGILNCLHISPCWPLLHVFPLNVLYCEQKDDVYLNLVLEFVPETVYRVARRYTRQKETIPMIFAKVSSLIPLFFPFLTGMLDFAGIKVPFDSQQTNKWISC